MCCLEPCQQQTLIRTFRMNIIVMAIVLGDAMFQELTLFPSYNDCHDHYTESHLFFEGKKHILRIADDKIDKT
jgi:hypothetical protein